MIFKTALRCGKSGKHDVHRVILGTRQNGGSSIAIQVKEVSIESVASNQSSNTAAVNAEPDKLRKTNGLEPRGGLLGSIFAGCVPLASWSPYPIIVYSVANYRPHVSHFGAKM